MVSEERVYVNVIKKQNAEYINIIYTIYLTLVNKTKKYIWY